MNDEIARRIRKTTSTSVLADVDIRHNLRSRLPRPRDAQAEDRALEVLATEMAENPRNMLQKLAETALEFCQAGTAGVSLLETQDGQEFFRWEALAGVLAGERNKVMPRSAIPCGVAIDQNATQLMHKADRCFPALPADPAFIETLLIPFQVHGHPFGTVWVASHTSERRFDREDERFLTTLGRFASAGWQLWKTCEIADNANRAKDEFLARVSHELRTTLSAILGATRLLVSAALPADRSLAMVELIQRNARVQLALANDLLDISRIVAGKLDLEIRDVDLMSVIQSALQAVRAEADAKRISVAVAGDSLPVVQGDAARLQQVMSNLLINALKFTPPDGNVEVRAAVNGWKVKVRVKDNGIGIAADFLPFVFDKFRQGEAGLKYGGLGLGLAIARDLVELHGGSISVDSAGPGRGATFEVLLPLTQASPGPSSNVKRAIDDKAA